MGSSMSWDWAESTTAETTTTMLTTMNATTSFDEPQSWVCSMPRDVAVGLCSVKYGMQVYDYSNYEDNASPDVLNKDIRGASQNMVDFLQGTGFMELTFLFYGNYR